MALKLLRLLTVKLVLDLHHVTIKRNTQNGNTETSQLGNHAKA